MDNTTNYNLKKPKNADFYNIEVQNENMDLVDAIMKELADGQTAGQILTKLKTVDGAGSGLDADLLRGKKGYSAYTCAQRDLNGVLIKTGLLFNDVVSYPLYIDIKGFPYSSGNKPTDVTITTYLYLGNYQPGTSQAKSNGGTIVGLRLLRVDGVVAVWFPYQGYYTGYQVYVGIEELNHEGYNYVESITASSALPLGADRVYEPIIHRTMFGTNVLGHQITPANWYASGGYAAYPAYCTVFNSLVKVSDMVTVAFEAHASLAIAQDAGVEVVVSANGHFVLYAKKVPIGNLIFDYSVVGV